MAVGSKCYENIVKQVRKVHLIVLRRHKTVYTENESRYVIVDIDVRMKKRVFEKSMTACIKWGAAVQGVLNGGPRNPARATERIPFPENRGE